MKNFRQSENFSTKHKMNFFDKAYTENLFLTNKISQMSCNLLIYSGIHIRKANKKLLEIYLKILFQCTNITLTQLTCLQQNIHFTVTSVSFVLLMVSPRSLRASTCSAIIAFRKCKVLSLLFIFHDNVSLQRGF